MFNSATAPIRNMQENREKQNQQRSAFFKNAGNSVLATSGQSVSEMIHRPGRARLNES